MIFFRDFVDKLIFLEKVGREKLLAKILGKSRNTLVLRKQFIIIFRMF